MRTFVHEKGGKAAAHCWGSLSAMVDAPPIDQLTKQLQRHDRSSTGELVPYHTYPTGTDEGFTLTTRGTRGRPPPPGMMHSGQIYSVPRV